MMSDAATFDRAALEALCVDNVAPTFGEIRKAKEKLSALLLAATEILDNDPVIEGVYVRNQPAFARMKWMMQAAGWRFCGSGYYSAAFFRDGLTIKVGFKAEDSGLMYAAWCRANQGKAGVPIIHKLASQGTCFMVLMDRLEAITGELTPGTPLYCPQTEAEVTSIEETINHGVDGWGDHMELCRTAIGIREFFVDIAKFDIHRANVMLDRDGNVVITDPIAFAGDWLSDETSGSALYRTEV